MTTPPTPPTPASQPTPGSTPTTPTAPAAPAPAPAASTPTVTTPGTTTSAPASATPGGPQAGTPAAPTGPSPLDTLIKGATDAAQQARAQVARAAQDNRGRITAAVDRLGATIDGRTSGRYHQHVERAKGWVAKGVDTVAGTTSPTVAGGAQTAGRTQATPGTTPATPTAPAAPAAPAKPAEGWHRGPNGEWVRS